MRNADFSLTGEKSVYFSGDKGILMDLNRNHEIIKLVTGSLVKSHKQAAANVGDGQLGLDIYVDGRYTHSEVRPVLTFLIIIPFSRPKFLITSFLGRTASVSVEAGAAPSSILDIPIWDFVTPHKLPLPEKITISFKNHHYPKWPFCHYGPHQSHINAITPWGPHRLQLRNTALGIE